MCMARVLHSEIVFFQVARNKFLREKLNILIKETGNERKTEPFRLESWK